jgi:hypothetical protein
VIADTAYTTAAIEKAGSYALLIAVFAKMKSKKLAVGKGKFNGSKN